MLLPILVPCIIFTPHAPFTPQVFQQDLTSINQYYLESFFKGLLLFAVAFIAFSYIK
jgi:hypothetical protein